MRVTKWGELGILSLAFIATRYETNNCETNNCETNTEVPADQTAKSASSTSATTNASAIAVALGVDVDYARQVLQRLKNAGLVSTVRGPSGGYSLTIAPSRITLEQILLATEGATFETLCDNKPLHSECHSQSSNCNLRTLWGQLADHITSFLRTHTLQNILDLNPDWAPGPNSVTLINISRTNHSSS